MNGKAGDAYMNRKTKRLNHFFFLILETVQMVPNMLTVLMVVMLVHVYGVANEERGSAASAIKTR